MLLRLSQCGKRTKNLKIHIVTSNIYMHYFIVVSILTVRDVSSKNLAQKSLATEMHLQKSSTVVFCNEVSRSLLQV